MEKISIPMARRMLLAAQALCNPPKRPATKNDLRQAIRRMGLLQIDTINVVARSPYLVLWSRLGDYPPVWVDELLAEGALFEYWAHAMCFLPIEDYPIHRRRMLDAIRDHTLPVKWAVEWSQKHPEIIERVRTHLQENGAVRSAEFENKNHKPGGWWNWKEEKDALEALLFIGEVMIARRQNFQRVYDLRERVLPGWDDSAASSTEEMQRSLILQAVSALGVAFPAWVAQYYYLPKTGLPQQLDKLAAEGRLLGLDVEGLSAKAYIHPENAGLLEAASTSSLEPTLTTLLSPFDPLVSDRQRARDLFNFDYTIECYTPAPKRRYGYFTLPILHRGRLVGRLDPKAHRAQGLFEVKALHLEPGVLVSEELASGIAEALRAFAAWHKTPDIVLRRTAPTEFLALLEKALSNSASFDLRSMASIPERG